MSTIGPEFTFELCAYRMGHFESMVIVWQKLISGFELSYEEEILPFPNFAPWKCLKCGRIWIFDEDNGELISVFCKNGLSTLPQNLDNYIEYRVFSDEDKIELDILWTGMVKKKHFRKNLSNTPLYTWTAFLKNDFTEILAIPRLKDECHKYV